MVQLLLIGLLALQGVSKDPEADMGEGGGQEPMELGMEPMGAMDAEPPVADRADELDVQDVSMENEPREAETQAEEANEEAEERANAEAQQTSSPATSASGTTSPGSSSWSPSFPEFQLWKHELLESLLLGFPGFDFAADWYAGVLFPYAVTGDLLWNVEYGCLQTWRGMAPLVWRGDKKIMFLRNGQVSRAMILQALDWLKLSHRFRSRCPKKSKFYLGLVTSMLLDSYAPAHVLRDEDGCGHIWQFQNLDAQDAKLHKEADAKFHHSKYPGVWKCARSAVADLLHAHQKGHSLKRFRSLLKRVLKVAPHRSDLTSGGSLEPFVSKKWTENPVAPVAPVAPIGRHRHRHAIPHSGPINLPFHRRHHRFLETVARTSKNSALLEEKTEKYWGRAGGWGSVIGRGRPLSGWWGPSTWNSWNWGSAWNTWKSWRGWRAPSSFFASAPVLPYHLYPRSVEVRNTLFGKTPRFYAFDYEEPEYVPDDELYAPSLCVAQAGPFTADLIRTWDFDLTAKSDELSCEIPLYS